jgi:chromosome condensin MukBEF MukE localization factor
MSSAYNEDGTLKSLEDQSYEILLERLPAQEQRIKELRHMLDNREEFVGAFSKTLNDFYEEYPAKREYVSEGVQYKKPRLRTSMIIKPGQWVEVRSSLAFTDEDKLTVAQRLQGRVGK